MCVCNTLKPLTDDFKDLNDHNHEMKYVFLKKTHYDEI